MKKNNGYGLIPTLIAVVVIAILAVGGVLNYRHNHKTTNNSTASNTSNNAPNQANDPYAGWKTATSDRAKFSIKYPSDWQYSQSVGDKDNVEHIRVSSSKFQITIDSFNGKELANGGTSETKCSDCLSTISSESFNISNLGFVNLEQITYKLDSGSGNALILRSSNGTYYLLSPSASNISSRFRGISTLASLQDYQNEAIAQFTTSPDFATAQKILKSVSY